MARGIWSANGVWYTSQKEHWLGWLSEYDSVRSKNLAGTFSKICLQPYPVSIHAALAGRGHWNLPHLWRLAHSCNHPQFPSWGGLDHSLHFEHPDHLSPLGHLRRHGRVSRCFIPLSSGSGTAGWEPFRTPAGMNSATIEPTSGR